MQIKDMGTVGATPCGCPDCGGHSAGTPTKSGPVETGKMPVPPERELFIPIRFFPAEREVFAKKEKLTVSEWAEKYRFVPIGAHRGRWRNELSPHLSFIMDTSDLPHVREIVICKSPQTGGTEGGMLNFLGYKMDRAPATAMLIMPSEATARKTSSDRIISMFADSPRLNRLLSANPDDTANMKIKLNNGGIIYLAWSNSASALASFPIKYIFFDETDKYPPFVGKETDPITLGEKRARTFRHTYKIFKISTPTREDGPIYKAMQSADALYKFFATCPDCNEAQAFEFSQLKWPETHPNGDSPDSFVGAAPLFPPQSGGTPPQSGQPQGFAPTEITPEDIQRDHLAEYACKHCGVLWDDYKRDKAVRNGQWRRTKGENIKRPRSIAFHLPSFISSDVSLSEIAAAYIRAKTDRAKLIDFYNDYLAEPFIESEQGESIQEDVIYNRRYNYGPENKTWHVPLKACVLTAFVDVQQNRLEAEAVAWGSDHESWGIEYRQFPGDPSTEQVWNDLDAWLLKDWLHESGSRMKIAICGIDSGFKAAEVYRFVRKRQARRVYACKGSSTRGKPLVSMTMRSMRKNLKDRSRVTLILIGTEAAKDSLFSWMQTEKPGQRYMHFHLGYGYDYFRMLTAEQAVVRYDKGRPYRMWLKKHPDARNEALDIRCGNYAMLELLNPDCKAIAEGLQIQPKQKEETKPEPPKANKGHFPKKGGWIKGWK